MLRVRIKNNEHYEALKRYEAMGIDVNSKEFKRGRRFGRYFGNKPKIKMEVGV